MLFERYPSEVKLKDGTAVVLRPMNRMDERALTDFFATFTEEDRLYLRNDISSVSTVRTWIKSLDYKRVFPLLAVVGERIVGNGTLHRKPYNWMRHIGEVRIAVAPDLRRKGLGRLLAEELIINGADEGLKKLTAEMVVTQKGAQKVFSGLGFEKEAVLKGYIMDWKGKEQDLIVMTHRIKG